MFSFLGSGLKMFVLAPSKPLLPMYMVYGQNKAISLPILPKSIYVAAVLHEHQASVPRSMGWKE